MTNNFLLTYIWLKDTIMSCDQLCSTQFSGIKPVCLQYRLYLRSVLYTFINADAVQTLRKK